jgi:RNA polymerase sigma factor (TIGR02999 family)
MSEVTRILAAMEGGDPQEANQLLPLVYDELRKLAGQKLAREKPGQTLQPTALVHEAYLRLVCPESEHAPRHWDNRGHFFAAAAEAMRRILIDNARRKSRHKRSGDRQPLNLDDIDAVSLAEPAADGRPRPSISPRGRRSTTTATFPLLVTCRGRRSD